jgi:hypothetical protein
VIFPGLLGHALDPSTPLDERDVNQLGAGIWNRVAASGHAAAPPSPAMKSRRRRQKVIWPSHARLVRGSPVEGG